MRNKSNNLRGAMLAAILLVAGLVGLAAQAALTPVDLRCGMRVNPLGIGDVNPRLSWQLQSSGSARGESQSAYEIQVGSTAGAADLWDSGKVASPATVDVIYAGRPLVSGKNVFWQVRVYDGSNTVSAWSAPARWSMGLLSPSDWTAQWIGDDAAYNLTAAEVLNNSYFNTLDVNWISCSGQTQQGGVYESALRKQVIFPFGQAITNAVMALYADNLCSVYVNGQAMTNPAARWEATAKINVTPWLHPGTNEVVLGATSSDTQETASVIGRLVVQFASGSVSNLPVDTTWKAASWPAGNWTQTNYNDSAWSVPSSSGPPWGTPSLNDIKRVPAPYLRKNFVAAPAVTRAMVYVTALGAYEVHLNGQKVGNDVLTPGWTQFTKRVYYQTYDVTGMVQPGTNTISAILGDGWYASVIGFTGRRQFYGGTPRFMAQLVLEYSDGSTQTVASDGSWKASYGPIQWGDIYLGSEYDARRELPGWDTTNYDDSAWSPVVTGLSTEASGYADVTTLLSELVVNNQLNIEADNSTLGGDPAVNDPKTLEITYKLGAGASQTQSFAENTAVNIGGGGTTLTILKGLYGNASQFPGSGYTNATALVASLVSNNTLNFVASNTTMGGDPAMNIAKTFQITFRIGSGTNQTLSYAENSTVSISGKGQALTVVQAFYGNAAQFPTAPGILVQAAVTEPARPLETVAAKSLTVPNPGWYTFDLGQNMVGWPQLNISGKVGDRITVRYGEMLNPNGTVYTANLRGATATDFYIFATNGAVTYQPRFTFHGFRYVEIRGLSVAPTINSVTGIVVHSDMPRTGSFASSSSLLNQLYSNIIWGQKGNYLETATDCPQRDERLGWSGDTEFFAPTAAYNYDVQTFFRRHMVTFCEDSQESDGSYDNVAPTIGGVGGAAWADASWICTYTMYRSYGDTNIIGDHFAALQHYGQYLASLASNYVISSRPGDDGDWLNLGGGASSAVIDTAFYAYYAQAMSEMAAAIGDSADAATYAALHSNIVTAFASFFNSDGSFTDGSNQTGYALAFTLNLIPANLRAAAAQQFANSIAQFDGHLATGFIGTPRLLPALHIAGRDDLAYTVLLQQTYPSWLYQVTLGATTMWERWDGWTPGGGFETVAMNSFNHYSFGAVGQYLYGAVGGINAASPGYKTILIQPVPGAGLTWANTSYNSTRGTISTAWTNTGTTFNLATVVPPNTTAQIYLPTTNPGGITESGVPAALAPGVTYVGVSNGSAIYAVGSGSYYWSSPYYFPPPPAINIAATNETGGGTGGAFTPTWSVVTNGDLVFGHTPTSTTGNFDLEPNSTTRNVNSLTAGGSLTITTVGNPTTTSGNYVTCGNGNGAGSSIVYTLTGAAVGYNLTNITVYGGWQDNGRDQQAYTVDYSTVTAPATFIPLTAVSFNPSIANNLQSATRVTLTSPTGALATNVAAVKFDFTTPGSENGYCGYSAIAMYGLASVLPPATLQVPASVGSNGTNNLVMNLGGLFPGQSYTLQSTTNLAAKVWTTETSFTAAQSTAVLTNRATGPEKFYRVVGN